jgi:hypothetical protein
MGIDYQRRDPQPLGRDGEVALVVLAFLPTAASVAGLVGLGIACQLFGGGWIWPRSEVAVRVIAGLAAGHPGRGLPAALAARVPGPVAVYGCVAAAELLAVAVLLATALLTARYWQPNDPRRGMATRGQAAAVLGVRRLRAAKAIIRPDLYPPRRQQATKGDR